MKTAKFEQLIALVLENEASAEQVDKLHGMLKQDPLLLEEAQRQFTIHGQLGVAMESDFTTVKFLSDVNATIVDEDGGHFSKNVVDRINRRRWTHRIMTLAALLVIGIATVLLMQNFSTQDNNPESKLAIASVKRLDGVKWQGIAHSEGDSISRGQSLKINSGLIEIDLDGRGNLIIEGPAHIDFTSGMEAVLHRGSLVMRATEKGHGYTVKTSQGSIVDLGTEFAVSVGEDNVVETHVIDGSVEAVASNGKVVTLLANDARRFDTVGGQSITADIGRFYTKMPPRNQESHYIHWSFDENKEMLARSNGELGKKTTQSSELVFHAIDEGLAPQWVKGVNNSAIHFDGKGGFAQSNYKGIQGGQARSVCFWVKVPKDFSLQQGFGIVSWGNPNKEGETWQISVNPLDYDGQLGRLRLGLHGGQIIGSTDLRDGKWHHISVVLYGGSQPNVGTHALLYVDGVKEAVSRASLQEVKTDSQNDDHGIWIGRNVTYRESTGQHPYGRFFRGSVDELYIFDAALSQSQIKDLMKKK